MQLRPRTRARPLSCATSSRALSPGFTGDRRPSSPSLAKTRFSPMSGTASAMVAIATIFMNDFSSRSRSFSGIRRSIKPWATLNATPAPHKRLAGISAARLIGIDHGQRGRNALRAGKMMVGDDQVHAQAACRFRRSKGADAHIHTDNELDAGSGGPLDDVVTHVIAIADAVRNMEIGGAAAQLNRGLEDDDCGGAIHVVIAINQDRFFVRRWRLRCDQQPPSCPPSGRANANARAWAQESVPPLRLRLIPRITRRRATVAASRGFFRPSEGQGTQLRSEGRQRWRRRRFLGPSA